MQKSNPTVLVVSDGPAGDGLGDTLAAAGYRVAAVPGAEAGLRRARRALPELVVLAVQGADPDAWEASRRLKADPLTAPIPVLVLVDRIDRARAVESGCDAYLKQPLSPAQLLKAVAALLDRSR